jgi:hypothetical protein
MHEKLDPDIDARKYFDFSWKEMGDYDVPAQINFVL